MSGIHDEGRSVKYVEIDGQKWGLCYCDLCKKATDQIEKEEKGKEKEKGDCGSSISAFDGSRKGQRLSWFFGCFDKKWNTTQPILAELNAPVNSNSMFAVSRPRDAVYIFSQCRNRCKQYVRNAIHLMFSMTGENWRRQLVISAFGSVGSVSDMLKYYAREKNMTTRVLWLCRNLSRSRSLKSKLRDNRVDEQVLATMNLLISNNEIAASSCAVLWNLSVTYTDCVEDKFGLMDRFVDEAIVSVMRLHMDDPCVIYYAFGALRMLALNDTEGKKLLIKKKSYEPVLEAMKRNKRNEEVMELGRDCLRTMFTDKFLYQKEMNKAGFHKWVEKDDKGVVRDLPGNDEEEENC